VELTDAATGRRLVGDRVVGVAGNDPDLIDAAVAKVAVMLRERIGDHVRVERWRAGTRSSAALASVSRAQRRAGRDLADGERSGKRAPAAAPRRFDARERVARRPRWAEPHVQRAWIARTLALAFGPEGLSADSFTTALGRGVSHSQAALRVQPGDPRALEAHGVLLHLWSTLAPKDSASRLRATAERLLRQATNTDSTLARALNVLSSIHFGRGELDQARIMAVRAHRADAYSEDANQVLGRLFQIDFEAANDTGARGWCSAYARQFRGLVSWLLPVDAHGWMRRNRPTRQKRGSLLVQPLRCTRDPVAGRRSAPNARRRSAGEIRPAGGPSAFDDVHATIAADSTGRGARSARTPPAEAGVRVTDQPAVAMNLLRAYMERSSSSGERVVRER
jgi:hypothetical protein